jgi:hypothetical protein
MSQDNSPNSQPQNQRPLTAQDALAFILVGDWEGEAYEGLDPDQLERMATLLQIMAENRLIAAVDVPPISEISRRMQAGNN